jgi:hypothetical protein
MVAELQLKNMGEIYEVDKNSGGTATGNKTYL